MRRVDVVVLLGGAVVVVVLFWAFRAKIMPRGSMAECPANLREIYVARGVVASEQGSWVPPTNVEELESVYRTLCSNGLAMVSTVCARDTRNHARTISSLASSNVSYFVTSGFLETSGETLLAGNRNLGSPGSTLSAVDRKLQWQASMGLHGINGYVLLGDGSIRLVDNFKFHMLATNAANASITITFP